MKLFVNSIEFGIIEVLVRNDGSIKEVKEIIHGKIGLNVNLLNLFYNGEILEDNKTLDKYEIINNSVINVVNKLRGRMRVFVENNEKIFAFEIEQNEKIINAKLQIFKSLKIDDKYFYLVYNDKIFDGDETLIEFGLQNKSLINIVKRYGMHIFAETMDGKTFPFEVHKSDKIINIKHKIQEKLGLHPDLQQLFYQRSILDDERTIGEYQICEKSVINVVQRLRGGMQIYAKTMDGKFVAFEVRRTEKIINIKHKIQEKIGLHRDEQILFYKDVILYDERTIGNYGICDGDVINIVVGDVVVIFAETIDGKRVSFEAKKSDKIIDIKHKIQDKIKLDQNEQIIEYSNEIIKAKDESQIESNLDEQIYIYKGVILEDDKRIDEYQISDQSVINIINKSKIQILINLEIFDGRKFKLCAEKQTKIIDIKKQIEFLINFHPFKQRLYYQGVLLERNENTLKKIQASINRRQVFLKRRFIWRSFKPKNRQSSKCEFTISVELSNDWLEIFVERPNHIQNKLCVFKCDTIFDVKNKIHQIVNVSPDEQILYFNESILENNKTVEQSNIVEKTILRVEFNLKNIHTITCSADEYEKIGNIKKLINEKKHINEEQKIVLYSSNFSDNKIIVKFEIKNKEQKSVD